MAFALRPLRRADQQEVRIVLQNENGPCPLLALCNALALRGDFECRGQTTSFETLVTTLSTTLLDRQPKATADERAAEEQRVQTAVDLFPRMLYGLDVNVRFTSVTAFEYTEATEVFDLFRVELLHGWLPDPQERAVVVAMAGRSYNQLMDSAVRVEGAGDAGEAAPTSPSTMERSVLVDAWMSQNSAQLTYHGIAELHAHMQEGQIAVLFRNNHFSTLHKRQGLLYLLVTDQGYADTDVFWELLSCVDNDTSFFDANFRPARGRRNSVQGPPDHDHQVALHLQQLEEERLHNSVDRTWVGHAQPTPGAPAARPERAAGAPPPSAAHRPTPQFTDRPPRDPCALS